MHVVSLLFGTSIVAVAMGLESHRRFQDHALKPVTALDKTYVESRAIYRRMTNGLLALIGCLALAAGFVGGGPVWIVLWALVPLFVVAIVVLAMFDMLRTKSYLSRKMPELRAESLGARGVELELAGRFRGEVSDSGPKNSDSVPKDRDSS